jgi:negative regulator of sigma E activity
VIEAEAVSGTAAPRPAGRNFWTNWVKRSWELSFPQLAAAAAVLVLVVSLSTTVGLRRWQSGAIGSTPLREGAGPIVSAADVRNRSSQQQQSIAYWNQRVEFNKARWSPQMRETFDRNLKVIDEAVNDSFDSLSRNPHDEVSEEMLNAALNEKLSLLKEFAEL